MDSFLICDLSHTAQGINSELAPYALGCIKSHFHAHSPHDAEIVLVKYPEKLPALFEAHAPGLVAFSNYMWNSDLSYTMAEEIRRRAPDTLIVFGGPNYPLESARQEAWLRHRPAVDVVIAGEGEKPFLELANRWIETHSIEAVQRAPINGLHAIADGEFRKTVGVRRDGFDDNPRIENLDATPSPYLMGYLDEFLADPNLVPLMETNRGCPYTCAFCVDGIGARSKVNRASIERLGDELRYIATRYDGKYLTVADTNFGMYREDIGFSELLAQSKRDHDYPHYLQVSTGKSHQERIVKCNEILDGSLRIASSVQSLDPEVLANVKRRNISYEKLIDISMRTSSSEASTYSEMIIGLPGDSLAKFKDGVCKLVEAGFNQIRVHTLMLLEGSELATEANRQRFDMKIKYRVTPRSFGIYPFGDRRLVSAEIEEACPENSTMPLDDYVECRKFLLSTVLFYNDTIFFELANYIRQQGGKISQWLRHVHARCGAFPERLQGLYDRFAADTRDELCDDRAALEREIKTIPGVIEDYIEGRRGNNVLFNAQAEAWRTLMPEMHRVAFGSAIEFLGLDADDRRAELDYLRDLQRYTLAKRRGVFEVDEVFEESFDYDFLELERERFSAPPTPRSDVSVRFYYEPWQRAFFSDQLQRHGDASDQALGKVFSRIPIKHLIRRVEHASTPKQDPLTATATAGSLAHRFGPGVTK